MRNRLCTRHQFERARLNQPSLHPHQLTVLDEKILSEAVLAINELLRSTTAIITLLCYIQAGFSLPDTLTFHLSQFVAFLYRHSILRIYCSTQSLPCLHQPQPSPPARP